MSRWKWVRELRKNNCNRSVTRFYRGAVKQQILSVLVVSLLNHFMSGECDTTNIL